MYCEESQVSSVGLVHFLPFHRQIIMFAFYDAGFHPKWSHFVAGILEACLQASVSKRIKIILLSGFIQCIFDTLVGPLSDVRFYFNQFLIYLSFRLIYTFHEMHLAGRIKISCHLESNGIILFLLFIKWQNKFLHLMYKFLLGNL